MRHNYNLGFISDNDIFEHVKLTVESYRREITLLQFNENIVVHKHPLAQKRHESHFVFNLLLSFTHISRWFQRTEFEWIGKCGCDERTVCSGEF